MFVYMGVNLPKERTPEVGRVASEAPSILTVPNCKGTKTEV